MRYSLIYTAQPIAPTWLGDTWKTRKQFNGLSNFQVFNVTLFSVSCPSSCNPRNQLSPLCGWELGRALEMTEVF
jgi:hypothetical protein